MRTIEEIFDDLLNSAFYRDTRFSGHDLVKLRSLAWKMYYNQYPGGKACLCSFQ